MKVPFDLRGELIRCMFEDGVMFAPVFVEDDRLNEKMRGWFTADELRELADAMDHVGEKYKEKENNT